MPAITHLYSIMVAGVLGLVLAIVVGVIAIGQVSAIQDVGEPLTTGALQEILRTPTFLMLLIAVVAAVAALAAPILFVLRR